MRKKDLIRNLDIANARISQLENLLCPAQTHNWRYDYDDEYKICRKCGKVVWLDD